MKYAKLIEENLVCAPKSVTIGHTHFNPPSTEWIIENRYKQLAETPIPEPVEGYYWIPHWEETEYEIVRVWEKIEIPDEVSAEEMKEELEAML